MEAPFKAPLNQQLIMSWAGLRGAASIVFAIVAVVSPNYADDSIFSIVFCIVLLSLLFQGALLPSASKHLNMIDEHENVLKTFNDYTDENNKKEIELVSKKGTEFHITPIDKTHIKFQQVSKDGTLGTTDAVEFVKKQY